MIIAVLVGLGLCLGSFVNALVWRLREQETVAAKKQPDKRYLRQLSVTKGRSMCPNCHHELVVKDLVPLLSWLSLRGKCRYCHKPIAVQYPLVEALSAGLFVVSYTCWPVAVQGVQVGLLGLWLAILTALLALLVYDLRWMLLPNRLVYPVGVLAALYAAISICSSEKPLGALLNVVGGVLVGGGIFYVLFQASKGKWIGGGDVKLGWVLGLVLGTPSRAFLYIFVASVLGTLISMPLLAAERLKRTSLIPFGPFLIAAAVIVQFFGDPILHWYGHVVLMLY